MKDGNGYLYYNDESTYDGEFKDDLPNGVGKKTFKDGSLYVG